MRRPSLFARIGIGLIAIGALMEAANFFEAQRPDSDLVSSEVHPIEPESPKLRINIIDDQRPPGWFLPGNNGEAIEVQPAPPTVEHKTIVTRKTVIVKKTVVVKKKPAAVHRKAKRHRRRCHTSWFFIFPSRVCR